MTTTSALAIHSERLRRDVPAHLNVFAATPRVVMSMYFAAQDHIVDDLRRGVRWDVAIIDEAHHGAERMSEAMLMQAGGQGGARRRRTSARRAR